MTTKQFSDFKISFNLNLEVDVNMRKIAELVKILSAHSSQCPDHLRRANLYLESTIDNMNEYIEKYIVNDGTEN